MVFFNRKTLIIIGIFEVEVEVVFEILLRLGNRSGVAEKISKEGTLFL